MQIGANSKNELGAKRLAAVDQNGESIRRPVESRELAKIGNVYGVLKRPKKLLLLPGKIVACLRAFHEIYPVSINIFQL